MNLRHCEKFIRALRLGITRQHVREYKEALQTAYAELHLTRDPSVHPFRLRHEDDHELTHALNLLIRRRQPLALRIRYLLMEGFLEIRSNGTLWPRLAEPSDVAPTSSSSDHDSSDHEGSP